MALHKWHFGRDPACSLFWSHRTQLFKSVELYLRDVLEIFGKLSHYTGRRLCTTTVDAYHGLEMYVFVFNLTKYLYYRGGNLIFALENGF